MLEWLLVATHTTASDVWCDRAAGFGMMHACCGRRLGLARRCWWSVWRGGAEEARMSGNSWMARRAVAGLIAAVGLSGCGPTANWGPLAVVQPVAAGADAATTGTIRITDACVFVERQGEETLLVWPSDRTTWSNATRSITFVNDAEVRITVTDGMDVALGGGESSTASAEDWIGRMPWVQPPAPECVREIAWFVNHLDIPQ